jgi:hypothetical protein
VKHVIYEEANREFREAFLHYLNISPKLGARTVDGVEVDILLHLKDGREILIFLDGARFHGADPKTNGGSLRIASGNERRAALIGPRVETCESGVEILTMPSR